MLELGSLLPHARRAIHSGRPHLERCRTGKGLYTVGLSHLQSHPELLVRGLNASVCEKVIDVLASHVLAGVRYHAGAFEVLDYSARLVSLSPQEIAAHLPVFNECACYPPAALQIVLAEDGLFPWERGGDALSLLAFPAWRVRGDA